jgi:phytoene desaturase
MVAVPPQLIRLQAFRSVYSMVAKHIRDPHLRHYLVSTRSWWAAILYHDFDLYPDSLFRTEVGCVFPKGGTGALVEPWLNCFSI